MCLYVLVLSLLLTSELGAGSSSHLRVLLRQNAVIQNKLAINTIIKTRHSKYSHLVEGIQLAFCTPEY
jgi:hypothetical protein